MGSSLDARGCGRARARVRRGAALLHEKKTAKTTSTGMCVRAAPATGRLEDSQIIFVRGFRYTAAKRKPSTARGRTHLFSAGRESAWIGPAADVVEPASTRHRWFLAEDRAGALHHVRNCSVESGLAYRLAPWRRHHSRRFRSVMRPPPHS